MPDSRPDSVIVAMLGARMHYAVPGIFHNAGLLHTFFTDTYATPFLDRCLGMLPPSLMPAATAALRGRQAPAIPADRVKAFQMFGMAYNTALRLAGHNQSARTGIYVAGGSKFCRLIIKHGLPDNTGSIYGFNSACLELFHEAHRLGIYRIMEQVIAPAAEEAEIIARERDKFPGWEKGSTGLTSFGHYCERETLEWELADMVICPSEYVKDAVVRHGGPAERCVVVPYGFNPADGIGKRPESSRGGKLRVITAGSVCLRKGYQYLPEVARILGDLAEFRAVGDIMVEKGAVAALARHVQLLGRVPRDAMSMHYRWADVFLLPSLCEGSATVCYEALSYGLPVICTTSTGSVIRHGIDGFILPPGDGATIAGVLSRLAGDRELLAGMSAAAQERARDFTVDQYGRRLLAALRDGR